MSLIKASQQQSQEQGKIIHEEENNSALGVQLEVFCNWGNRLRW